jgi:hypothetical protein
VTQEQAEEKTMDRKDFAIGILSTTAVILSVTLIFLLRTPQTAVASGMGDRGGDYIMLSGQMWSDEELLYVVDTAKDRMIAYRFDRRQNQIVVAQGTDLEKLVAPAQSGGDQRGSRRRP